MPARPATPDSLALCLHGKVSSAASASHLESRPECKSDPLFMYNRSLDAHTRLAHQSHQRYIISVNQAAGVEVGVFLHSWTPEAAPLLEELYKPSAARHEPPLAELDKVQSQHLSLKRCVALVPRRFALVLVSRYDMVFLSPVLSRQLPGLGGGGGDGGAAPPRLWLPQACQTVHGTSAAVVEAARGACGCAEVSAAPGGKRRSPCAAQRDVGRGQLSSAPYMSRDVRISPPRVSALLASSKANHLLWVLDYFFVATRQAAASFGLISSRAQAYEREIRAMSAGPVASGRPGLASPGFKLPRWSHFFWAVHVHRAFGPAEVRWLPLLNLQDFVLGRRWWQGATCRVPVAPASRPLLAQAARERAPPPSTWILNGSRSPLAEQCPPALRGGAEVLCAWNHPACRDSDASRRVNEMLKVGGRLTRGVKTTMKCFSP